VKLSDLQGNAAPAPPTKLSDLSAPIATPATSAGPGPAQPSSWLKWAGQDPSVDYGPGLGFDAEQAVKRADNDGEVRLALERRYGQGSAAQDPAGNWYVTTGGKKVSVFGENSGFLKRAATSLLSIAPETAGMYAGAAVGGAAGGALGAVAGAGVGGALGKGVDELYKHFTGTLDKTPEQERKTLEREALWSAGGEVGGRTLSMLGRVAIKPKLTPWIHVTPEMEAREADLRSRGIVPTIEQATGGETFKIGEYEQKLTQMIWGNPAERKNIEALNKQLISKLQAAGVPPDKVQDALTAVVRGDIPMTDANRTIFDAVNNYSGGLVKAADQAAARAQAELNVQYNKLESSLTDPKIELSDAIRNDIEKARETFRTDSGRLYGVVDDLAVGRELVDTAPIKAAAQEVLNALPKTAPEIDAKTGQAVAGSARPLGVTAETNTMAYVRDLLKLPDRYTVADASRIRSTLLDLTREPGLTPGIGIKELNDIRNGVDNAIEGVAATDPHVLAALKTANTFYREGITKFQDVLANRLVKDAELRGAVEPDKVMETIVKGGKVAQANRIMGFLAPQTRQQLSRDYFNDIVRRGQDLADPSHIVGARLAQIVTQEKPMIDAVLGKGASDRLAKFATNAANFDGKLPIKDLNPDTVGYFVQTMKAAQEARDKFMSEHFLSALARPGQLQDSAFDWLAQPRQIDRLDQVMKSPIGPAVMPVIKQKVMQKILSTSTLTNPDSKQLFTGSVLKNNLTNWGREYLTKLYGEETTNDLFRLADSVANISARRSSHAVGFVATTGILLHPLTGPHLKAIIATGLMSHFLLSRPGFIKWLIQGYEGNSTAMRLVAQTLQNAMRAGTQMAVPQDKTTPMPPAVRQSFQSMGASP
jgi:hypothetical protein